MKEEAPAVHLYHSGYTF